MHVVYARRWYSHEAMWRNSIELKEFVQESEGLNWIDSEIISLCLCEKRWCSEWSSTNYHPVYKLKLEWPPWFLNIPLLIKYISNTMLICKKRWPNPVVSVLKALLLLILNKTIWHVFCNYTYS